MCAALHSLPAVAKLALSTISTQHAVSDETFARSKQVLGDQGVVDLRVLTGTCGTVAMLLSMAQDGVLPGKEPPLSRACRRHHKSGWGVLRSHP